MYRERLTITLHPELVQAVDALVDRQTIRNRSQAIEFLLEEGLVLHRFTEAFLFIEDGWTTLQLTEVLKTCQASKFTTLYLCLSGSQAATQEQEVRTLIEPYTEFTLEIVPGQFGSGGALLLHKAKFQHTLAAFWIGSPLENPPALPFSCTPAYSSHRHQGSQVTLVLSSLSWQTYQWSGLALLEPSLTDSIGVGVTDLLSTTFPRLEKEGRLSTYVNRIPVT